MCLGPYGVNAWIGGSFVGLDTVVVDSFFENWCGVPVFGLGKNYVCLFTLL